jgi:sec-independent protein translocase protein TatA
MDLFSIWHWLIVVAVLLLLFGGHGKISEVMGDVAKGIKAFKDGITDSTNERVGHDKQHADSDTKA